MSTSVKILILTTLSLGLMCCVPRPATATFDFTFQAADQGAVVGSGVFHSFRSTIANTGTAIDTLTITLSRDMPATWTTSFCEGSSCYPPFVTQITTILAAGAETALDLDITPDSPGGSGAAHVTVVSGGEPTLSQTLTFTVVTPDLDVLVVADDQGAGLASYYTDALTDLGHSWGVWPRTEAGALSQVDLAGFGAIIWFTGAANQGLENADLQPLAYYLQHGGGLLLSGQNVAWAACDTNSGEYSSLMANWFDSIMGVIYLADDGGDDLLIGVPGDPIGNDWSSDLTGGTGANDNSSPDSIRGSSATPSLTYANGATAAARNTYGAGRSLFCAFGCEDIATAAARRSLISATLTWFHPPSAVILPTEAWSPTIAPNPFNPAVNISWDLPRSTRLAVTVYDLSGHRVVTLRDGIAPAGPGTTTWRGTNSAGRNLPSGIYFCQLTVGQEVITRKLTLVR